MTFPPRLTALFFSVLLVTSASAASAIPLRYEFKDTRIVGTAFDRFPVDFAFTGFFVFDTESDTYTDVSIFLEGIVDEVFNESHITNASATSLDLFVPGSPPVSSLGARSLQLDFSPVLGAGQTSVDVLGTYGLSPGVSATVASGASAAQASAVPAPPALAGALGAFGVMAFLRRRQRI